MLKFQLINSNVFLMENVLVSTDKHIDYGRRIKFHYLLSEYSFFRKDILVISDFYFIFKFKRINVILNINRQSIGTRYCYIIICALVGGRDVFYPYQEFQNKAFKVDLKKISLFSLMPSCFYKYLSK